MINNDKKTLAFIRCPYCKRILAEYFECDEPKTVIQCKCGKKSYWGVSKQEYIKAKLNNSADNSEISETIKGNTNRRFRSP